MPITGIAILTVLSYAVPLLIGDRGLAPWLFGGLTALTLVVALAPMWARKRTMQLGNDGFVVADEFIPWSEVMEVVSDAQGVQFVCRTRDSLTLDVVAPEECLNAAYMALAAYQAAPPAPELEVLRVRVETSEERATRLAALRGNAPGYRGADPEGVDLEQLEALVRNPTTDSLTRREAAQLLARLDSARLERLQGELEGTLDPAYSGAMEAGG